MCRKLPNEIYEPFFINSIYLPKMYNRSVRETAFLRCYQYANREVCNFKIACYCGNYSKATYLITDIILNNKGWVRSPHFFAL